jgi:hypothetical protein
MPSTLRDAKTRPKPAVVLQPEILTILATYKCTAACENCCFGSNPYLTKRLGLDEICSFIKEGAQYPHCELVVFSGGECFLLGKDLVAAIEYASCLGLRTRCVTNGYWAKSLRHGRERLTALKNAGLSELNVSTGDYHQRWVPQESVVNAASLSAELGFADTLIVVELQKARGVTGASVRADPRIAALLADDESRFRLVESPWMPMNLTEQIDQSRDQLVSRSTLHLRGGCDSIFRTAVVTPDRRFGYCCGLPREQIPELNGVWNGGDIEQLVDAGASDFMKIWLFVDGPERILAWAATKDSRIEWEYRYGHRCHACLALFDDPLVRNAIRDHYTERVDDVLMRYVARLRLEQGWSHDLPIGRASATHKKRSDTSLKTNGSKRRAAQHITS